ncbi:MAG: lysophospholipid acyltransferase family protein [Syntrophales bacterium]|nr:lysophospholipid acyltransferase family protein [Syntrophales bacterium]
MSNKKTIKFRLLNSPFTIKLVYLLLKAYTGTVKVRVEGLESVIDHLNGNGRVILCSWHQRFFAGFYLPQALERPITIMISRSSDGDFISSVTERIGWIPVRGSSSRGGKQALREIISLVRQYGIAGHIADGPTGPPRLIKLGIVILAQQADAAICPVYVHYDNVWVFNSWDRFMVPKPGSGVLMRFGPLEYVPEDAEADELEDIRKGIEAIMIHEYEKYEGNIP